MSAPLTNFEGDFVGTLIFFSGQKLNFSERVKYPSMGGGGGVGADKKCNGPITITITP